MLNILNTFSRYLVDMIVSKFNSHKYMNIILSTGLGKSFILLKYIENNKNIINMNRIIELGNLFDRKMKINKLIQKINNDN